VLLSSSGLACLTWDGETLRAPFVLRDGLYFPGTAVNTRHWLVKVADLDGDGRVDMLFQTQNGITVLGKEKSSWEFDTIADHDYGRWIDGRHDVGG